MAKIIKVPETSAIKDSWSYEDGEYVEGADVRTLNYQYPDSNRSLVVAEINGDHGWSVSASDYYYFINEGTGEFETEDSSVSVCAGDTVFVPSGTKYNYKSVGGTLRTHLIMGNLWTE
jgi:Mannose-6-phosphate isomerase